MKNKPLLATLVAQCALLATAGIGHAAMTLINIDFQGPGLGAPTTAVFNFAAATGSTGGTWNQLSHAGNTTAAQTATNLVGSDGAATTVDVSYWHRFSGNPSYNFGGFASPYGPLMNEGGVNQGQASYVDFSSLAAGTYDVYAYSYAPFQPSRLSISANGVSDSLVAAAGVKTFAEGENWVVLKNVTVGVDGLLNIDWTRTSGSTTETTLKSLGSVLAF